MAQSPVPPDYIEQLRRLDVLIHAHDQFWKRLNQDSSSSELRSFLFDTWAPFNARWAQMRPLLYAGQESQLRQRWPEFGAQDDAIMAALHRTVETLSTLRDFAMSKGLPVPDIGTSSDVAVNRETDRRFWDRGYKPQGQRIDPHDPADAKLIPIWLAIRQQVLQEQHPLVVGALESPADPHADPLVDAIWREHDVNRLTDRWFWLLNDVDPNYRLDVKNPRDAKLIREWRKIQHAVTQEFDAVAKDPSIPRHWTNPPSGADTAVTSGTGATMHSLDPWRPIVTDLAGNVVWPLPYYGHPFYRAIPSWVHYADGGGTQRLLFDGAFVGAEPGLTAEVGPVVAPAARGLTFRKELDAQQVLHVEICVDGKCYRTSMDLAPALALVMQSLSQWHENDHARMAMAKPQGVDAAVGQAADLLVGALVAQHMDTICGSFLGDIAGAVSGAVHGVTHVVSSLGRGVAHGVSSTFKKFKGPIGAIAATAAASGAALIPGVGPIAAPIAGKLANDLVQAAAGDDKAKQQVADAKQQAKTDPAVAVALDEATKAVANATVAHHVQDTAKQAAQGSSSAQQQILKVAQDAAQGDPTAKAVADLIANAFQTASASSTSASGWVDIAGQNQTSPPPIRNPLTKASPLNVLRAQAFAAAQRMLPPAGWSNYIFAVVWNGYPFALAFNHQDSASAINDLFEKLDPDPYGPNSSDFLYAAVFDATDPRWPRPISEATGPGYSPVLVPQGKPTMPPTWRLREAAKVRSGGWVDIVGQGRPQPLSDRYRYPIVEADAKTFAYFEPIRQLDEAVQQTNREIMGHYMRREEPFVLQSWLPFMNRWNAAMEDAYQIQAGHLDRAQQSVPGVIYDLQVLEREYGRLHETAIATWKFRLSTPAPSGNTVVGRGPGGYRGPGYARGGYGYGSYGYGGPASRGHMKMKPPVVGASPLDEVRKRAKAIATAKLGAAVGVIHTTLDDHWHAVALPSLDAAVDWLQRATYDRSMFTYAAAFEKAADGTAYVQDEEIGGARGTSRASGVIGRAAPGFHRGGGRHTSWAVRH